MLGLMRLAPKGVGGYQAPTTAALQRMLQFVDGIIGPCSGMGGLLRVLDPALANPHLLSGDSAEDSWVVWAIADAVIATVTSLQFADYGIADLAMHCHFGNVGLRIKG